MNAQLFHLLQRADRWPVEAQRELEVAAREIENRLLAGESQTIMTLREMMQASPLADVDLQRCEHKPEFRDVIL